MQNRGGRRMYRGGRGQRYFNFDGACASGSTASTADQYETSGDHVSNRYMEKEEWRAYKKERRLKYLCEKSHGTTSRGQNHRGRGNRHPPGLVGRDIGLWYAQQNRGKQKQREEDNRPSINLDHHEVRRIASVLDTFKDMSTCKEEEEICPDEPIQQEDMEDIVVKEEYKDDYEDDFNDLEMRDNAGPSELTASVKEEIMDEFPEDIKTVMEDFIDLTEDDLEKFAAMERVPCLDEELKADLNQTLANPQYQELLVFRERLPAYEMKSEIVNMIRNNQVVVLSGETGCGKTTQVPQFILEDMQARCEGSLSRILVTQPRRISAISVAERVAAERGQRVGRSVGYQIRLEKVLPGRDRGTILFCTTGVVLQWLQSDPKLQGFSHIILDEIHERDVQSDFLMTILRDILPQRPDLRIVLMSATLNAEKFSAYFSDCPKLDIPGRIFPVKTFQLENAIEMTGYQCDPDVLEKMTRDNHRLRMSRSKRSGKAARDQLLDGERRLNTWLSRKHISRPTADLLRAMGEQGSPPMDLIARVVHHIVVTGREGAILVFVPGMGEIKNVIFSLRALHPNYNEANGCWHLYPLHSCLPTISQREVFCRPPPGHRKIIVATNIAETSITIDDVVFVVDSGRIKVTTFEAETNTSTLAPVLVSKANAAQRRGRAGRVQPGECYHLYSSYQEKFMVDYLPPEILRIRLEEVILRIKLLGLGNISHFLAKCLDPPSPNLVSQSKAFLINIQALDECEELTPLGWHLAHLPMDPQCAKIILLGALFCCLDPALTVAACLSYRDPFFIPFEKVKVADMRKQELAGGSQSDHIVLVNAIKGYERARSRGTERQYCWDNFLSESIVKQIVRLKKEFATILHERKYICNSEPKNTRANQNSENLNLIRAVICGGLYPNIVQAEVPRKRRNSLVQVRLRTGIGEAPVELHPKSVNRSLKSDRVVWMTYFTKIKLDGNPKSSIFDTTVLPSRPIIFFGGHLSTHKDNGKDCIAVDNWIKFGASTQTAQMIMDLRERLNSVLNDKIKNPDLTDWSQHRMEGSVMQTIVDMLSTGE